MSAWLYVYYRVDPARRDAARAAVDAILVDMRRRFCARARLLCKIDEPLLWMEAYEEVPDRAAFERALDAAVRRHGLGGCLPAGERRHVEAFEPECA